MKIFIRIITLVIALSFAGCWNTYNDVADDMDEEYKIFLAVTSGSGIEIETFPLNNGVPDFNNYQTNSTADSPRYPALHPTSNLLYVPNSNNNTISMYQIDDYGNLTSLSIGTITVGNSPWSVKIHPSGNFLYVSNLADDTISMYKVNSDGTLADLTPGTVPTSGTGPTRMAMDPAGNYLFVITGTTKNIQAFSINTSTGILTSAGSIAGAPTANIKDVIIDSKGHLYVSCSGGIYLYDWPTHPTFDNISYFIFQTSNGTNGCLAFHPSANYFYYSTGVKDVGVCQINSDGTLSSTPISQITVNGGLGQFYDLVVHPSGKYIYLAEYGDWHICYLIINNDGTLTEGPTNLHHRAWGLSIIRKKVN
jgi:6-phosphogluconolactonase